MNTKDRLLSVLKENRGAWVSGEMLSKEFGISRAAIWKHARKLKEDGYGIEASPKKGYFLNHNSAPLLPDEIKEGLKTRVFGKTHIHTFKEIDSTNTKAKELAETGAPEGTLVIAEKQTQGRGRRGRKWHSSPGNGIYASLILRPPVPPMGAPRITLMTAVAVAEALLSQLNLDIKIKWPNDILVNKKKLVGILTEISAEMDSINYIVVGFGINVNTPFEDFPSEIRDIATSIRVETGAPFSRVRLIRSCLEQFEKYYDLFKQNDFKPVLNRWKQLSSFMGQKIIVDVLGKKHAGEIIEVDDDGVLILKDNQGEIHKIFSGDITLC